MSSFIQSTMRGRAAEGYDPKSAAQWANSLKWLGLAILNSYMEGDDRGFVEFIAKFTHEGQQQKIHERSEFQKIHGAWFYTDGTFRSDHET